MKLTDGRVKILQYLASRNSEVDGSPSAMEIGRAVAPDGVLRGEWASPHLRALEKAGLVEKHGWTTANARTWRITAAGRDAINPVVCDTK